MTYRLSWFCILTAAVTFCPTIQARAQEGQAAPTVEILQPSLGGSLTFGQNYLEARLCPGRRPLL